MSVVHITSENYEKEVLQAEQLVLVDFWAPWCGPCKMISPILDELAEENKFLKIVKINVDEHPELAQRSNVMSIPTLVLMKNGKSEVVSIGLKSKKDIQAMITSYV